MCYDLSLIRSREWGRGLVSYLNDLVSRGHNAFYSSPPGNLAHLVRFLAVGLPRLFRKNIGYFLTAAAIFFGTLGVTWAVIQHDPHWPAASSLRHALNMMEEMYSENGPMGKPRQTRMPARKMRLIDISRAGRLMAGFYVKHNAGIALDCFGRGILLGFGTVYTLI